MEILGEGLGISRSLSSKEIFLWQTELLEKKEQSQIRLGLPVHRGHQYQLETVIFHSANSKLSKGRTSDLGKSVPFPHTQNPFLLIIKDMALLFCFVLFLN